MSKHYKNPPLSEVVCEFQFGQDSSWDLAIPGLVYEKVREKFPVRSQVARVTMGISTNEGEIGPQIGTTPIMRFSSEAEILHFLEKHPLLVPLLLEAYTHIEKYFSHPLLYLAIDTDPEEFTTDQLVVLIATALKPDEAIGALSEFDKAWWLDSLKRAQGKLCITLEFL